jgi:hypothetical protein
MVTKDLNFILEGRFKIFFFDEKFLGSIGEEKIENIILEIIWFYCWFTCNFFI